MGQLRIIGGEWRGRMLSTPTGLDTRPLTNRIRQSLFDCLGQRLDGYVVADCCAGSGSFGFEALSRGAASVYAIESGAPAIACLRHNAHSLSCAADHHLITTPLPAGCHQLPECDLIFCDPPFPWYREQPELLQATIEAAVQQLAPDGILLLRGERGQTLPPHFLPQQQQQRQYGRSWVSWIAPG
ncbi:MAG: 16S rRNA (guanine(966)-N(2))-methyltransferase RsmD [Planctomycetota bacterium]|nr:MAG: 16S rRNA (guanine(966)-N(2))-methyltransferase RsmD [Planctomycetota bacterium]